MDDLKERAEEFLDRNKDGEINVDDFHALQRKEKILVVGVLALGVIVIASLVLDLTGAVTNKKKDKPAEPVVTDEPAEEPAKPEVPVVSLSEETITRIAAGVASRVQSADPEQVADHQTRIEALEGDVKSLKASMEDVEADLDAMEAYAEELLKKQAPPKKRKRFLGIF